MSSPSTDDPYDHPDLAEMGRLLRSRIDAVLGAEQEAEAAALRRRRALRDRLLDAEDRCERVVVTDVTGAAWVGSVTAVGTDHVAIGARVFLPFTGLVSVQFEEGE